MRAVLLTATVPQQRFSLIQAQEAADSASFVLSPDKSWAKAFQLR